MRKPAVPRCLVAAFLCGLLALVSLSGCSAKITHDPGLTLAEKVKSSQNAYLRYAQAEEDARREGNLEAQERYRQAKEGALADAKRYDQELAQYMSSHPGRLRTDALP